ncbi:2-phospho-L-lactate transferase [Pseudorhodoplanes sp.]|uniref:2-phospho-L-lactate transferase n=1 Tax=Pseudorhodoplanes sp. TaxID=1934341 RepID=UPI003D0FE77C
MNNDARIALLCGGVGGAKLALGLARVHAPSCLTIVVNTADDFEHLGLHISPDIDTVTYTLAGLANPSTGWGQANETWECMATLDLLGGETWFRLGDRDLATHLQRTSLLNAGMSLTDATACIARRLGVGATVLPMTDSFVRTELVTDAGTLAFQHYFVKQQCIPEVRSIQFRGYEDAPPTTQVLEALSDKSDVIIIAPSNPFLSIDPILALPGVRDALRSATAPVVAVSPIIGAAAFKGPTTKLMIELGIPTNAFELANYYCDIIDHYVIDTEDASIVTKIQELGISVETSAIRMDDDLSKERLARCVLNSALAKRKRMR